MGLTDRIVQTVTLPDGATVEVRKPGARIHDNARKAPQDEQWQVYLHECVKSWSYDEPLNDDSIGNLALEDVTLLMHAILGIEPPKNSTRRSTKA